MVDFRPQLWQFDWGYINQVGLEMGEFTSNFNDGLEPTELWIQLSTFRIKQHNSKSTTLGGKQPPNKTGWFKTKNDQTLWLRWILDPYPSCSSWGCPFRWLLWSLLFHVYLAVDGDGEAKKYTSARKAWAIKEFGCYCLSFLHCKELAWYVDLDFFSSSCWLNLQVHNLFQPLEQHNVFSRRQCGYPAAKTLQKSREETKTKLGWKIHSAALGVLTLKTRLRSRDMIHVNSSLQLHSAYGFIWARLGKPRISLKHLRCEH